MLGHDNVSRYNKVVPAPDAFEGRFEEIACRRGAEVRKAMVAAERKEMKVPGLMIADQPTRHLR